MNGVAHFFEQFVMKILMRVTMRMTQKHSVTQLVGVAATAQRLPPQNLPIRKAAVPPTAPHDDPPLVLGLSPTTRGMAYVVMEGARNPLDWGLVTARVNKNAICIKQLNALCAFYTPRVLVTEKPDESSRRSGRI